MHEWALKTRKGVQNMRVLVMAALTLHAGKFFFFFFNMLLNLMGSVNSRRCAQSADHVKSKHFKSGEF